MKRGGVERRGAFSAAEIGVAEHTKLNATRPEIFSLAPPHRTIHVAPCHDLGHSEQLDS